MIEYIGKAFLPRKKFLGYVGRENLLQLVLLALVLIACGLVDEGDKADLGK